MTVDQLLDQLDATRDATGESIRILAEREVSKAKDFIQNFETSVGASLDKQQRLQLADHLWSRHVDPPRCTRCPFEHVLASWYAAVQRTQYWSGWESLHKRDDGKPPKWSAAKKLHIYLSLQGRDFEATRLRRQLHRGRPVLKEGNNRVAMLAAMCRRNLKINVQCLEQAVPGPNR